MNIGGLIEKFDTPADGSVIIHGVASTETPDSQGEIVKADAIREALPGFMKWANIREMHQPSAVGTVLEAAVGQDNITRICAKIVDSEAVRKVRTGVYKAFTIGGERLAKIGNAITRLNLTEISLCDRPANPECVFSIAKMENPQSMDAQALAKFEALPGLIEALTKKLTDLETKVNAAPAADPNIAKLQSSVDLLVKQANDTQAAVELNQRRDAIAKMARDGRCPNDPATGLGYKPEDLLKLDLASLNLLAANAPKVPLKANTLIAKSEGRQGAIDTTGLVGEARVLAANEAKYSSASAFNAE